MSHMLKLERANLHLEAFKDEVENWRKDQARKVSHDLDVRTGKYVVHTVIDPLPRHWNLILGDCVQNLRSALDHLAFELTTKSQGAILSEDMAKGIEFPIFGDKRPSKRQWETRVGLIDPKAVEIIEKLQPYNRGNSYSDDLLWRLQDLNRFDKHRYIQL